MKEKTNRVRICTYKNGYPEGYKYEWHCKEQLYYFSMLVLGLEDDEEGYDDDGNKVEKLPRGSSKGIIILELNLNIKNGMKIEVL